LESAAVQAELQSRLRPTCIHQFTEAAETLNIVLEELKKKFPKEGDVVRARLHEMAVI
jgi:molybdopterin converting factor small subunit